MFSLLNQFVIHLSLVLSFALFLLYPLRRQKIEGSAPPFKNQLLIGLIAGLMGAFLLSNPLTLDGVPIDVRLTVLLVALFYGGWIAGAVTSVLLLVVQGMLILPGDGPSVWWLLSISILLLLTERWMHQTSRGLKAFGVLLSSGFIYSTPVLYMSIGSDERFLKTLMAFLFLNSLTSVLLYFFFSHVQHHFQELENERKLALTDDLTQLNNRRKLRRMLCQFEESNTSFTVLIFDIDSFKQINDTYGHEAGDSIIQQMGNLLTEYCPKSGTLGRYGGEEFLLLLPRFDVEQTIHLAETIRSASASTLFWIDPVNTARVTLSIGVSWYEGSCSRADVVHQADLALYEAKKRGKNQVATYIDVDLA